MRRQETPSPNFHAPALQFARLVRDPRADGIGIRFASDQADAEPMIVPGRIVAQQNRRGIIIRDQDVNRAIVIKIADGQTARGK
jgi:hypothetical protein